MDARRALLGSLAAGLLISPALSQARAAREPYFPNVVLDTHDGRKVRFYDDLIKGRIVVINMMYTACTNICPPSTANLLEVQKQLGARLGRDVFMYSITLQPEIDSPAALRDYMKKYDVKAGWTFLTGKRPDIELIRRKLGFYDLNPEVDASLQAHTGMVRIGHDGWDRWSMAPALGTPRQIVRAISNYL